MLPTLAVGYCINREKGYLLPTGNIYMYISVTNTFALMTTGAFSRDIRSKLKLVTANFSLYSYLSWLEACASVKHMYLFIIWMFRDWQVLSHVICWIPAGSEAVWFATWWGEGWWEEERWCESVPIHCCMVSMLAPILNMLSAFCLFPVFPLHRIRRGNTSPPSLPGWGRRNVSGDQKLPTNYHKVSSSKLSSSYTGYEQYIVDWDKKSGWDLVR